MSHKLENMFAQVRAQMKQEFQRGQRAWNRDEAATAQVVGVVLGLIVAVTAIVYVWGPTNTDAQASTDLDTGTKALIGLGGIALVGGAIWAALKKMGMT